MNIDFKQCLESALPFIKRWWFSIVSIPFCWILADQYWMALKWEISFSWMYSYPLLLSPFFFFIDNFLLIIHEAGHTFFGFFGNRFLAILGGTLLEILLPLSIFFFGWWNFKRIIAQLGLLLTAFAWIESSAYAADAVARKMPLIGNLPKSSHDFYNLFMMNGSLDGHMTYAWIMYWIGIIFLILFLLYPLIEPERYEYEKIELDL